MKLFIQIIYTMDSKHPDFNCVKGKNYEDRVHTFEDIYRYEAITLGGYQSIDDFFEFAKHDMALVAGGGYNTEHIHNVKYVFHWES